MVLVEEEAAAVSTMMVAQEAIGEQQQGIAYPAKAVWAAVLTMLAALGATDGRCRANGKGNSGNWPWRGQGGGSVRTGFEGGGGLIVEGSRGQGSGSQYYGSRGHRVGSKSPYNLFPLPGRRVHAILTSAVNRTEAISYDTHTYCCCA